MEFVSSALWRSRAENPYSRLMGSMRDEAKELGWFLHLAEANELRDHDVGMRSDAKQLKRFLHLAQANDLRGRERVSFWVMRRVMEFTNEVESIAAALPRKRPVKKFIPELKKEMEEFQRKMLTHIERHSINQGSENLNATKTKCYLRRLSLMESADTVGLQEDMDALAEALIFGEDRLISIVGMGGLGKTTLARKIYNCRALRLHFSCRAFVSLSQHYVLRSILLSIVESTIPLTMREKLNVEKLNDDELKTMIFYYLSESRYLVVIDDIWSTQAWDDMKMVLPPNHGRVLLTTRKRQVALHAMSKIHDVRPLSAEQSWELFLRRISTEENATNASSPKFARIGRQVLAKCEGLPLAIVESADLITKGEMTLVELAQVFVDNGRTQQTRGWKRSLKSLRLSYDDLPYYLKPCFLYLGLFPADMKICSKTLLDLWNAEGFIQKEHAAEDYLKELIDRCMVQVDKKRYNGFPKTCCIHNLFRVLCISKLESSHFFKAVSTANTFLSTTLGHLLVIHRGPGKSLPPDLVHSILAFSKCSLDPYKLTRGFVGYLRVLNLEDTCFDEIFFVTREAHRLRYLNVKDTEAGHSLSFSNLLMLQNLNLRNTEIRRVPSSIGELAMLQSLNLRGTRIRSLPPSIGKLAMLESLNLRDTRIGSLPSSIRKLAKLQVLDLRGTCISPMPTAIQKLTGLKELHLDNDASSLNGGSLDVSSLTQLHTLSIKAGSWMQAGLGKLIRLRDLRIYGDLDLCPNALNSHLPKMQNLEFFRLGFGFGEAINLGCMFSIRFLESLHSLQLKRRIGKFQQAEIFLECITHLLLKWTQIEDDPMAHLRWLPNLEVLKLHHGSFKSKKIVCSKVGFWKLQILELAMLNNLEEWVLEERAMWELRRLIIRCCSGLKMLPQRLQDLSKLKELEVVGMPNPFNDRLQPHAGEDWNKIQHIKSVTVDDIQMKIPLLPPTHHQRSKSI